MKKNIKKTIYALVLCRLMKHYETLQGNTVYMLHQGHSAMEYTFFEMQQNAHLVNEMKPQSISCRASLVPCRQVCCVGKSELGCCHMSLYLSEESRMTCTHLISSEQEECLTHFETLSVVCCMSCFACIARISFMFLLGKPPRRPGLSPLAHPLVLNCLFVVLTHTHKPASIPIIWMPLHP